MSLEHDHVYDEIKLCPSLCYMSNLEHIKLKTIRAKLSESPKITYIHVNAMIQP